MIRFTPLAAFLSLIPLCTACAGELPRTAPAEVGLSTETLGMLKPSLQKLVDDGKIPGGVAVVARHGKVAYVTTFGYRDVEKQDADDRGHDLRDRLDDQADHLHGRDDAGRTGQARAGRPSVEIHPRAEGPARPGRCQGGHRDRGRDGAGQAAGHDSRPALAYLGIRLRRDPVVQCPTWEKLRSRGITTP